MGSILDAIAGFVARWWPAPQNMPETSIPLTGTVAQRIDQAVARLMAAGLSAAGAATVCGTYWQESWPHMDPSCVNKQEGAIGLGQWRFDRAEALKSFAAARGRDWTDFDSQVDFTIHEMQTKYPAVWAGLKTCETVDQGEALMKRYTRWGKEGLRLVVAREIFARITAPSS